MNNFLIPSPPEFLGLYRLNLKDFRRAAKIFRESFYENPMFKYMLPNEHIRKEKLHYVFEYMLKYGIKYGVVFANSKSLKSMAIWIPHSYVNETLIRSINSGGLKLIWKIGWKFLQRQAKLSRVVKECHHVITNNLDKNHIYLSSICVDPNFQGSGLARVILDPMINYARRLQIPIYLETAKNENISLYEHFGFQIVKKIMIPETPYSNFGMLYIPK